MNQDGAWKWVFLLMLIAACSFGLMCQNVHKKHQESFMEAGYIQQQKVGASGYIWVLPDSLKEVK